MGRAERFSRYEWAGWPDATLTEQLRHLYLPYVRRLEQSFHGGPELVIELTGEYFADPAQIGAKYAAYGHGPAGEERTLRLTWESRWEEVNGGLGAGGTALHHSERIFFLETYDEFYAGPFGTYHPSRQGVQGAGLYEVVSDPDPWIMEILRENNNTDTFPSYGPKALEYDRQTGTFSGPGRFLSADWAGDVSGTDFLWTGEHKPTPEQSAQMERQIELSRQQQAALDRSRPRYRHLFIASETVMVEMLCEGLPRWAWLPGPQSGE